MGNLERIIDRTPLLVPSISLITGILIYRFLQWGYIPALIIMLFAVVIYLCFTYLHKSPTLYFRLRNFHNIWLFLCFCGLGLLTSNINAPRITPFKENLGNCLVTGIVTNIQYSNSGDILFLDPIEVKTTNGHNVAVNNTKFKLRVNIANCEIGDLIHAKSKLEKIKDSENSFYTRYAMYMESQGVLYQGDVESESLAVITDFDNKLLKTSSRLKNKFEEQIENCHLKKQTQNFLIAILLGDKDYISYNNKKTFSDAGVSHVLALSGMHVSIITGILMFIFLPINFTGRYKLRYLLILIILWLYAFLTGMYPSTIRACIMCSFVFVSIMLERKNFALNSFCAAALFILIFSPFALFDIGFQLSFVCVGSFIMFGETHNIISHKEHPIIFKFTDFILITMIATFSTWIITAYYFHQFPLSFLPANLLCVPILPIYLTIGLIYIIIASLGFEIGIIGYLLDIGFDNLNSFLKFISSDKVIHLSVPVEAVIFWLIGVVCLAIYISAYRKRSVILSAIAGYSFSILYIFIFPSQFSDNDYIISNNYREVRFNYLQSGEEKTINLKRNCTHVTKIGNHTIATIDSNIQHSEKLKGANVVIIASGFKGDIRQLSDNLGDVKYIIHPSVRRKREQEYIDILKEQNKSIHSLRLDGSYKSYLH